MLFVIHVDHAKSVGFHGFNVRLLVLCVYSLEQHSDTGLGKGEEADVRSVCLSIGNQPRLCYLRPSLSRALHDRERYQVEHKGAEYKE